MPLDFQLKAYMHEGLVEAGCDEAGRGPLAGPVFAAAVVLPPGFSHPLLDDSKRMTERARNIMRPIIEQEALAWAVEAVMPEEIDRINILNASITGMQRAVLRLKVKPDLLLIDGNRFKPMEGYMHVTVVHGDATYASIAAASNTSKPSASTGTPPGTGRASTPRNWNQPYSTRYEKNDLNNRRRADHRRQRQRR